MNDQKASLKLILGRLTGKLQSLQRYSFLVFIAFVALLYGFVLLRINTLNSLEPTPESVTTQVKAAKIQHIDEAVVKQLESLQDNSVSVQALFDEARSNPFQQ